jgi:hypothetical protein
MTYTVEALVESPVNNDLAILLSLDFETLISACAYMGAGIAQSV